MSSQNTPKKRKINAGSSASNVSTSESSNTPKKTDIIAGSSPTNVITPESASSPKSDIIAGSSSSNISTSGSQSTPKKAKTEIGAVSPASKASLNYDFWAEKQAKVAKALLKDLEETADDFCKLDELMVCSSSKKAVKVYALRTLSTANSFKVAFEDSSGMMTFAAFHEAAIRLSLVIQAGKWYKISKFRVAMEKKEYLTGALNNMQITFNDQNTLVKEIQDCDETSREAKFVTIEEVKSMGDNTLVDILSVCVKDWGEIISATGKTRRELTLSDKTKECIRLTIWGDLAQNVQKEIEGKTILVKYANVSSYEEIKNLQTKWFSIIETQPAMYESYDLQKWFDEENNVE